MLARSSSSQLSLSGNSSNGASVPLVSLAIRDTKIRYFYLDGGSTSVFYLGDICTLCSTGDENKLELDKVAKHIAPAQLQVINDVDPSENLPPSKQGHPFVTVDGFLKVVLNHGNLDLARLCLYQLRSFIEESFATLGSSTGSTSEPTFIDASSDEDLILAIRGGVEVRDRKHHFKTYTQCFIGSEAVDWLVAHHWANTREEAVVIGQRLIRKGVFCHVSQEHDFRDKQYFYKFLEPQKKVEINERFKIVILGPANSGKSSLFRLLPLKTLKKSSAKGKAVAPEIIQRAGWKSTISQAVYANPGLSNDAIGRRQSSATNLSPVDNIEENILFTLWDFARDPELDTDPNVSTCSQIIHRLFLTSSRTLYLLCVDLSKFNAIEVDSHIQIIHTYAPHAPILLVGTHQDEVSSQRISQVESFIKSRYKKYKALKELSTVSCTSLKNISKLKNLIVSTAHACISRPAGAPLKDIVADADALNKYEEAIYSLRRKGTSTMTMSELRTLAKGIRELHPDAHESAIEFLASIGAIVTFPKALCAKLPTHLENPDGSTPERPLQELVVVNPNWLFKLVAKAKAHSIKKKISGILPLSRLLKFWAAEEIDPKYYTDLFDLLMYYRIVYSLPLLAMAESRANAARQRRTKSEQKLNVSGQLSTPPPSSPPPATPAAPAAPQNVLPPSKHILALPGLFPIGYSSKEFSPRTSGASSGSIIHRYYLFQLFPFHLMERIVMQLYMGTVLNPAAQEMIGAMELRWTRTGAILYVAGEHDCVAEVSLFGRATMDSAILLTVSGKFILGTVRFLSDAFTHLLEGEYNNAKYDILVPCTCTACLAKPITPSTRAFDHGILNDSVFNFSELEDTYARGVSSVSCTITDVSVPISSIAPDISMNDLAVTQVDFEALEFQKVVASGSYGKVWKGSYKGTTVAVKEIIMSEPETIGPIFREFRREVWTMGMACVHPNIVSYSGFAIRKTGSGLLSASSESPGLAILMEFIPFGNLYSYLHKEVTINWKMRLRIATDLTKGLTFLHSTNIVHHDMKSLNVFVAATDEKAPIVAKVGDFGEARISFSYSKRDNVANPVWLAPELLRGGNYTKAADVYSVGIILWEIASRELPFREYPEGNSQFVFELEQKIRRGLRPSLPRITCPQAHTYDGASVENLCCPRYAKLVQQCWDDNPAVRPAISDVLRELEEIFATYT